MVMTYQSDIDVEMVRLGHSGGGVSLRVHCGSGFSSAK